MGLYGIIWLYPSGIYNINPIESMVLVYTHMLHVWNMNPNIYPINDPVM
jgi:hypothetical protein